MVEVTVLLLLLAIAIPDLVDPIAMLIALLLALETLSVPEQTNVIVFQDGNHRLALQLFRASPTIAMAEELALHPTLAHVTAVGRVLIAVFPIALPKATATVVETVLLLLLAIVQLQDGQELIVTFQLVLL